MPRGLKDILVASFVIGFVFLVYAIWVSVDRPTGSASKDGSRLAPVAVDVDVPLIVPKEENLVVVKLEKGTFNASVEYSADAKLVSEWVSSGGEVVINGAYFNEDYTPSGLLIVDGKRIGTRKFDYDRSAALVIKDGTASIINLKREPRTRLESFDYVLQSFPLLIEDGKNTIAVDSEKEARRTAVGIDIEGNLYIVVSDSGDLSLYEFAEEIVKAGIPFARVLNLDGGPSTGVYGSWEGKEITVDSYARVSSIVRFKKK